MAAIVAVVVAVTGNGGGGGSGTTTAAPVLAPASSSGTESSEPASTSSASESTAPVPQSGTVVPIVRPISTAPATEPSGTDSTAMLVLPQGAFSPDVLGTGPPNSDRQEGVIMMAADEFAAALVEANPDWTGDPSEPDADGMIDFELTGSGRIASVHIELDGETSGAVIVAFTIDYT